MNNKILIVPMIVLLAACGNKNNDNKEKIYNHSFTYSGNYVIDESESNEWLKNNIFNIKFGDISDGGAYMQYVSDDDGSVESLMKKKFKEDSYSSVNDLKLAMDEMIEDVIQYDFIGFTFEFGSNDAKIIVDQGEEEPIIVPLTVKNTPKTKAGTSVDFESKATVSNSINGDENRCRGTISIGGWDKENKIQYTKIYMEENEGKGWKDPASNYLEFYFPLKEQKPSTEVYSIEVYANLLPINE